MTTNSHILIVWDCDAEKTARKLSKELPSGSNVTAFSFGKRENRITDNGIENAYEAELFYWNDLQTSLGDPAVRWFATPLKTTTKQRLRITFLPKQRRSTLSISMSCKLL